MPDPTPIASFELNSRPEEERAPAGTRWWKAHPWNTAATPLIAPSVRAPGYRGIWYLMGERQELGYKYSGGLGTYTANHEPMAVYSPEANKTFFTYGGTTRADERKLVIMVSYYDHERDVVPKPVALYFDPGVDDPHDNAALHIDSLGHIWVFKSGRSIHRPGIIFRSVKPYDISSFELIGLQEFTYPQIWTGPGGLGFFLLFTKYFPGTFPPGTRPGQARHLFWKTSADGRTWSEDHPLATFFGHYQTSGHWKSGGVTKYATFFNYHPDSDVDRRSNLYYAQTVDGGKTWTTADGKPLELPLTRPDNAALVLDLEAGGKQMYANDLKFDAAGNPVLFFVASRSGLIGPAGDPREWTLLHWTGSAWEKRVITTCGANYCMGSLFIDGDHWSVIGPSGQAPQRWNTGGEMELWSSDDAGRTWTRSRELTRNSPRNHSYARAPEHFHKDFAAFWADGHGTKLSPSYLYFSNSDGTRVRRLPYDMEEDFAKPEVVARP